MIGWRLLALTVLPVLAAAPGAPGPTGSDKVGGLIRAHREARRVRSAPGAERCAAYVSERLSAAAAATFALRGLTIDPDGFVPPVPGQHPLGYHLALLSDASDGDVVDDPRIVRLESLELRKAPTNDLARPLIAATGLEIGPGFGVLDGTGVRLAVADTGLDLTHADVPAPVEAFDVTDGPTSDAWGLDVRNTVDPHGTHVVASAVGSGAASLGRYAGVAPGASLSFYKIGNDVEGWATDFDMIQAIQRAAATGNRVFSLSFGGLSTFMDGSDPVEQAIDAATARGLLTFASAGNERDSRLHYSRLLGPGQVSPSFTLALVNDGEWDPVEGVFVAVIWRGGPPSSVEASCQNLNAGAGETLTEVFAATSPRGTAARWYRLAPALDVGGSKTYQLKLRNLAGSGPVPRVHVFTQAGTFGASDPAYTVSSPALADTAVAVGAIVHRKSWQNFAGDTYTYPGFSVGQLAPFSSIGPRLDGVLKPDLVAPGAGTISARDGGTHIASGAPLAGDAGSIIDDDGVPGGSARYYVMAGTSMACPTAAGAAALVYQADPRATAVRVRDVLLATAAGAGAPDSSRGSGLLDAAAAVELTALLRVDADASLRVDGFDLVRLAHAFGAHAALAHYDAAVDFDGDGWVDGVDLGLLATFFGRSAPPEYAARVAAD